MPVKSITVARTAAAAIFIAGSISQDALADPPVTWNFNFETHGENVTYQTPTAVRPNAAVYHSEYQITSVEAEIVLIIFPIWVDVTDLIPPEYLSGASDICGPCPILLADERIVAPPPPEPTAVEADLTIGVDIDGYGYVSATNIYLGEFTYQGVTVDILGIRGSGSVTLTAEGDAHPSDIVCDGVIDVMDLLELLANWGMSEGRADVNGDGIVDVLDLLQVLSDWS